MAIVEDDIERVRSAVSLVDVVSPYVQLKRVGRNHVGLCPFHAERTGSFNVRDEVGRYHCFGCGASGDVFRFVQEVEHVDFVAAVEQLRGQVRGDAPLHERRRARSSTTQGLAGVHGRAVEWYHQRLLTAADARSARLPAQPRGSTVRWRGSSAGLGARRMGCPRDRPQRPERVLRDTGLAFVNRRDRLQDTFRARLLFPIFNETGGAVAFGGGCCRKCTDPAKYKNSPETAIYNNPRGAVRPELGEERDRQGRQRRRLRGVHRRDRLPPRRCADRRGHLRHGPDR